MVLHRWYDNLNNAYVCFHSIWCTPLKTDMEPDNHLFEKKIIWPEPPWLWVQNVSFRGGGVWGNIMYYVSQLCFGHHCPYFFLEFWSWKQLSFNCFNSFNSGNYFGILEARSWKQLFFYFFYFFLIFLILEIRVLRIKKIKKKQKALFFYFF